MQRTAIYAALSLMCFGLLAGCGESPAPQTAQKEQKTSYAQTWDKQPKKPATKDKAKAAVGMGSDREFVNDATEGGLTEVRLGRIAANRATHAKVKAFAKQMVVDHSQANDALTTLARSARIAQPAADAKHDIEPENKLSHEKGADFDKAYVDLMVKAHKKDVSLFEMEGKKGENANLRAFALKTLPTLRHHLDMAQNLQKSLKK